jgi:hypothetical protein
MSIWEAKKNQVLKHLVIVVSTTDQRESLLVCKSFKGLHKLVAYFTYNVWPIKVFLFCGGVFITQGRNITIKIISKVSVFWHNSPGYRRVYAKSEYIGGLCM